MTTKLTTEQFIQKSQEIHGDLYDYSQTVYKHSQTKVSIICSQHGVYEQTAKSHLNGRGCPICGRESQAKTQSSKAKSEFVQKAQLVHGDKYDYSETVYVKAKTKVKILCREHGLFDARPDSHLNGQGCPHCAQEASGFTRTNFKDKCIKNNNGFGILYVLGCWDDLKQEIFIKIGITSNSIKKRYPSKASMPYNFKVLHEIVGDPEYIYNLETKLHKKSKSYRYVPNISFGGSSSECFLAEPDYLSKLNNYMSELIPF